MRILAIILAASVWSLLTACSTTILTGSWRNPDYQGTVAKVYIVGVSKQTTQRRIFEDEFGQALSRHGVVAVPSYRDLNPVLEASYDQILTRVRASGADAFLVTRILGRRTETVVNPARVTAIPTYSYFPPRRDHYYRGYYEHRYEMIFEPATVTEYVILTLESNLYDTRTESLIWSAELETDTSGVLRTKIREFVDLVTRDMVAKQVI